MYYGMIVASVVAFGVNFSLDRQYAKRVGSSFFNTFFSAIVGAAVGVVILLAINGFRLEYTPFTVLMAALAGGNTTVCGYFSLKTAARANLSLYAMFSNIGGMLLPSVAGLLFYREPLTIAKILCYLLLGVALAMNFQRSDKKGGTPYYIGVFISNGMNAVLAKVFTSADFPKTDATSFSIYSALWSLVLAVLVLVVFRKRYQWQVTPAAVWLPALNGSVNRLANWVLVIALAQVPASVQYPLVTGGIIIICSLFALFTKNKPTVKEWISVTISFIGLLILFLLPF